MLINHNDIIIDYFSYEENENGNKLEDHLSKRFYSRDNESSLMSRIENELLNIAVKKNDKYFHILLMILDKITDMQCAYYYGIVSYLHPSRINYKFTNHILFTLSLFNCNSTIYKRIIRKLCDIKVDRINFVHPPMDKYKIYNSEIVKNFVYYLLKVGNLLGNELVIVKNDYIYFFNDNRYDEEGNLIYVHSDNSIFDNKCIKNVYNSTIDDEKRNEDIFIKIIMWHVDIIGYHKSLDIIDTLLTDKNFKVNAKTFFRKIKLFDYEWMGKVKNEIANKYSSDICSLVVMVSDDILKIN